VSDRDLFKSDGPLARLFQGYELREAQVEMAERVALAFKRQTIAIIEAGTGTGKSLAYLVPALLAKGKRTVISTHTIALQEQLIRKDIPQLVQAIAPDATAVLVKGMGNYLCLRRLADTCEQEGLDLEITEEVKELSSWAQTAQEGSLSDLPFYPKSTTWECVSAESDSCTHSRCPFFNKCFFFRARQAAEEADLLVINHHLLMADLRSREAEGQLLPHYDQLVIDEAHHLEEVATEALAWRLSRRQLQRWLIQLAGEGVAQGGKLALLRARLGEVENTQFHMALEVDLPAAKGRVVFALNDAFRVLGLRVTDEEWRLRLTESIRVGEEWTHQVTPAVHFAVEELKRYVTSLRAFCKSLKEIANQADFHKTEGVRQDLTALIDRLQQASEGLYRFALEPVSPMEVRWIEVSARGNNVHLVNAQLDISDVLKERLFLATKAVVLTSATMATGGKSFDFYRRRLGLQDLDVDEAAYPSPFDYEKQALLLVANDLPSPQDASFSARATEAIAELLRACGGHAFVLFTAHQMMRACADALLRRNIPLLVQGDRDRAALLEEFRAKRGSVLFGTDSFWEGVDVVGDALRCVIITKLPFKVPTEPLIQARFEAIEQAGGNPFGEFSLPQAVIKFKQGFGRLIRSSTDRGAVVCLDRRLVEKSYGRAFLNSLPACPRITGTTAELAQALAPLTEVHRSDCSLCGDQPLLQFS
jgi:ATP-dependent DNA helicase DinG